MPAISFIREAVLVGGGAGSVARLNRRSHECNVWFACAPRIARSKRFPTTARSWLRMPDGEAQCPPFAPPPRLVPPRAAAHPARRVERGAPVRLSRSALPLRIGCGSGASCRDEPCERLSPAGTARGAVICRCVGPRADAARLGALRRRARGFSEGDECAAVRAGETRAGQAGGLSRGDGQHRAQTGRSRAFEADAQGRLTRSRSPVCGPGQRRSKFAIRAR